MGFVAVVIVCFVLSCFESAVTMLLQHGRVGALQILIIIIIIIIIIFVTHS